MASVLSSFFQRDPKSQFPYDIPTSAQYSFDRVSVGNSFKKGEPNELATIFWCSHNSTLKQQSQKLKTMRHPNIITYLDSIELNDAFYLVTERCTPLAEYFKNMDFSDEQKEFVVSWGIFQILNALKFMHDAKLSHENIRRGIYVTAGGDWKIGGLHMVSAFSTPQTDLNQLGIVIWEVFNGFNESVMKSQPPMKIPKRLHPLYSTIATAKAGRTTAAELIKENRVHGGYLKNKFVDTLLFLEEFELKESLDKQQFFTHLREHLDIFPDDVAKYKILPKLILTYEYGDAGPNILIPLFKLGRLLAEDEYQNTIVPCLCKLFGSPDRTTRVKLLERIEEFAPHLTPQILNDKIFGNLTSGFLDTSPAVRESTVKAMVSLADKLNYNNLNVELMKYLARLQGGDEHGGIRTNTTICLGKIGYLLAPAKRQAILISAFLRALKDPFPPSRLAAVLALSATQQFYPIIDIANRVVPALVPLTCDPEKQVRDQVFKAIQGFLEKLEKASENPACIPELEADVKAGSSSLLNSDKVPQWASWALKSLSGKFYKGTPPPEGAAANTNAQTATSTSSGVSPAVSGRSSPALQPTVQKPVAKTITNDGWGDFSSGGDAFTVKSSKADVDDGWDDFSTTTKTGKDDADDWGIGWDSPVETKVSVPSRKPSTDKKPAIGRLKLGNKASGTSLSANNASNAVQKSIDSNIDALFGIPPPKSAPLNTLAAKKTETNDFASSGWGFDEPKQADSGKGGWDDAGWGEVNVAPLQPTPALNPVKIGADKEARRQEMVARNEARRKEQADKKKAGAMKLQSVEKKMDDFADW